MRRNNPVTAGSVLAGVLLAAACSSGTGNAPEDAAEGTPAGGGTTGTTTAPRTSAGPVETTSETASADAPGTTSASPAETAQHSLPEKRADGIAPCARLSREDAAALGLAPDGKRPAETDPVPNMPKMHGDSACAWESDNGPVEQLVLAPFPATVEDVREGRENAADYREFEIDGYPAVQSNAEAPNNTGTCQIFVESSRESPLHAVAYSSVDPCGLAARGADTAIGNIPVT